jgi:hypothetical protein
MVPGQLTRHYPLLRKHVWPNTIDLLENKRRTCAAGRVPRYSVEKPRMNCVSLVGTVHKEIGQASVSGLCAILEYIRPEVIFVEVPPAVFDNELVVQVRGEYDLESKAIRQYRTSRQVKLVPVDLPTRRLST